MTRTAENNVNYQERATAFAAGDVVTVYRVSADLAGRVTAVWPGIGMVDVEFPTGNKRYPVEDLQLIVDGKASPPTTNSTPGGPVSGTSVSAGPGTVDRVANAYLKKALYWAQRDRKYHGTVSELATGQFLCPKCKEALLKPATYRRVDGVSEKLLGCPSCMFLIHKEDIINCVDNQPCEDEV